MHDLASLRNTLVEVVKDQLVVRNEFVILDAPPYYVQALFTGEGVYAEVVGDFYLAQPARRLHAAQEKLTRAGWNPPGSPCRIWCDGNHHNFHRVWPLDEEPVVIVDALLEALVVSCLRSEGEPITVTWEIQAEGGLH